MKASIRTQEMANLMGVTPQTIRKYVRNKEIPFHTQPSGQLFFTESDIKEILGDDAQNTDRTWVFYARSSSGNVDIIESQKNKLAQFYDDIQPNHIITDKASGLNENRKGLSKLIKLAKEGKVTDVAFTRPDRLTRFGYKYLEELFASYNVTLHHMDDSNTLTIEEELMDDFMAILSSFTGRHMAMKSRRNKRALLEKALQEVDSREDMEND